MKKIILLLILILSACGEKECDDFNVGDVCIDESGTTYAYNLTMSTDTFDMYERVIPVPLDGEDWGLLFNDGNMIYKIEAPSKFVNHELETFLFDIDGELISLYEVYKKDEDIFKDIINANYELPYEVVVNVYQKCDDGIIGDECVLNEDGKTHAYVQEYERRAFPLNYYRRVSWVDYDHFTKSFEKIYVTDESLYLKRTDINYPNVMYKIDGRMYTPSELFDYDVDMFLEFANEYKEGVWSYRYNHSEWGIEIIDIPDLKLGEEWCFNKLIDPYCVIGE